MKKYIIVILNSLLMLLISCEQEDPAMESVSATGEVVEVSDVFAMNSKENKGFSVDRLKIANFPKTDADFIIIPQTSMTGDVMSPFLSNPNLEKRFVLSDEFDDSMSAMAYFDAYTVNPAVMVWQQFALELKPNQVWIVKTHSGTFCKILILDTQVNKKTSYVEIKFKAEKLI
jgi:hypothetical protein